MDRRTSLKLIAIAGAGLGLPTPRLLAQGSRASSSLDPYADMAWGRCYEGQRKADLGNGSFLNPLFAGDSAYGGRSRQKFDVQMEVSGYHHNVAYDFLSLRPALYSAGSGEARFSNFTYRAL